MGVYVGCGWENYGTQRPQMIFLLVFCNRLLYGSIDIVANSMLHHDLYIWLICYQVWMEWKFISMLLLIRSIAFNSSFQVVFTAFFLPTLYPHALSFFTTEGKTAAVSGTLKKIKLLCTAYARANCVQMPKFVSINQCHEYLDQ